MADDVLTLDLVELRRKVAVRFPNGEVFPVAPFGLSGKVLLRKWQAKPDDAGVLMQLLRLAVPGATDEDFDTLSLEEDVPRILGAADGKSALMEALLKNGLSDAGNSPLASPSPPSSPTTRMPTRSRGSRGRSASPPVT